MATSLPEFDFSLSAEDARADGFMSLHARFFAGMSKCHTFFRKEDNSFWMAPLGGCPQRINSLEEFRGKLPNICIFTSTGARGGTQIIRIRKEEAEELFYSSQKIYLPLLKHVIYEPAVLLNGGPPRLTPRGFDVKTGVYYFALNHIEPREGTEHLTKCFSGVPFENIKYRNNLFAWLLGAVMLDPRMMAPLLAVSGNQRGIGKSKTVDASGIILMGQPQTAITQTLSEFEKQVGAKFRDGNRFITLDNITMGESQRCYSNRILSSLLTQGDTKSVRILGKSKLVSQSGVLFSLTANDCRLDADLTSRALAVKLHSDESQLMSPYVITYAQDHRDELYGELLALALQPCSPANANIFPFFRYHDWLLETYPRIKAHFGEMAIAEAEELDEAVIAFFSWGHDRGPLPFTTSDLIDESGRILLSDPAFNERFNHISSRKHRKIEITKFVRRHTERPITLSKGVVLVLREQENQFCFENL